MLQFESFLLLRDLNRQLRFHGFHGAAGMVSREAQVVPEPADPSNELSRLVYLGSLVSEGRLGESGEQKASDEGSKSGDAPGERAVDFDREEAQGLSGPRPFPPYSTFYTATHKGACRSVVFSPDGKLVTTASSDTSIKVLEVAKMRKEVGEEKLVIRTLYGSNEPINDVAFHPNGVVLASCAKDSTIRFYDLSRVTTKHPIRFLKQPQDNYNVRSLVFHPSGDFLLAATEHEAVRLYDMNTLACFVTPHSGENHAGPLNQVRYSPQGHFYVTAGKDGMVKVWDTVTSRCVRQFEKSHDGTEVSCASVSRNSKYILTTGRDSVSRLWDVGSGRLIMSYEGAKSKNYRLQSCFTWNEDHILCGDEASNSVIAWDTRTGILVNSLPGHTNVVRALAASPTGPGFMSGSEDFRARFWNVDQPAMS